MKSHNYCKIFFIILLLLISIDCFAGAREKIFNEIFEPLSKHIGKYIESVFRYFGLMGILIFMKTVSWSKMLIGSVLSTIGALYQSKQISQEGEVKIEISKFKLFIKGSLRFALIIAGIILIIGSIIDGVKGKQVYEDNKSIGYIGIGLGLDNDKNLVINFIQDGSAAYHAGLKKEDKIIRVDNTNIDNIESNNVQSLIRGNANTYVHIVVNRNDSIISFNIKREKLPY